MTNVNSSAATRYLEAITVQPDPVPIGTASRLNEATPTTNKVATLCVIESWQLTAIKRVTELGLLPQNWDGYGSPPPQSDVRNWAVEIILETKLLTLAPPEIGPVSNGGIQINWWSTFRRELELHIDSSGLVTLLKVQDGNPISESTFAFADRYQIIEAINWLRRG